MVSRGFWGALAIIGGLVLIAGGVVLMQSTVPVPVAVATKKAAFATDPDAPTADSLSVRSESTPHSAWFDAERKRYSALLATKPCDTLVVPVQSQHLGFDRATRSLMTAQLALALANGSGRCVVDPYLASDALGEGMRRITPNAVSELASAIKATTIVTVYAGHDGEHHLEIFATAQDKGIHSAHKRWDGIAFSDENPPFLAWRDKLPEVLDALGLGNKGSPAPQASTTGDAPQELPDAPEQLVTTPVRDELDAATRYELLAALGPLPSFRQVEQLHEKAWLAASHAPESAASRRVRARALMHLAYRPAALAVLGTDDDPSARALRALLDGNLPEAQSAVAAIEVPAEKLMASLEARDLRFAYGHGNPGEVLPDVVQQAQARSASWNMLLGMRGGEYDGWQVDDNLDLKRLLDSLYPLEAFSLGEIVGGATALGKPPGDGDLQLFAKRHIDRLLAQQPQRFCCTSFALHPSEMDFLQLLSARSLGTLEKSVRFELWTQRRSERALDLADAYGAEYDGNPHLAALRAMTLRNRAESHTEREAEYVRRAGTDALVALHFEQQGTEYGIMAAMANEASALSHGPDASGAYSTAYRSDFPPKLHWAKTSEYLPYAKEYPGPAIPGAATDALLAAIETRFHGSRGAEQFAEASRMAVAGDPDADALRARIERDPGNWGLYLELEKALLKRGDIAGIVALAGTYPGFADGSGEGRVALSNYAAQIAHPLFWYGQIDMARTFYERAANYRTGSAEGMAAAQRVAAIDGDYTGAMAIAQQRYARYEDSYALHDYLEFLFAHGFSQQAWPAFMANADQPKTPEFWFAALVGKRIEGADDASVGDWLASEAVRSVDPAGDAPALRLGMTYFMIDRAPFAGLPALLARIEGEPVNRVDIGGDALRHSVEEPPVERSAFRRAERIGKDDERVPSHHTLFAAAYLALRKGDYTSAVEGFERYANFYAIEGDRWDASTSVALPYFALAAAKSGDVHNLRAFLQSLPDAQGRMGTDSAVMFDRHLALAYFSGLARESDEATQHLVAARRVMALANGTHGINGYQYAETCIVLFDETKDARYRDLALEWARAYQRMDPAMAWPYALEAAYGNAKDAGHVRAVALALYLDRDSYWLSKMPKRDVEQARAWLVHGNPFRVPKTAQERAL